ncbi:MAG: S1C family serine protease, partial [Candidatus Obscuribacterales bacterium]|nr:S1C family serine protease [Candidatus Obscuribacterales bacterium]
DDNGKLNAYDSYSSDSSVAQIYMKNRPAIVRINTMDPKSDASFSTSAGSGSIIDQSGIIATGYHVVKNAGALRVKTADGKIYEAQIVDVDAAKDQALIKIKANNPWSVFPTVKLADNSNGAKQNEKLVALGFPRNQDAMHVSLLTADRQLPLSALKINGGLLPGEDKERKVIHTFGSVQSGNSGGPAFDQKTGEQIGMVNLSDKSNAYIVPVEDLHNFLARTKEKLGINTLPSRVSSPEVPGYYQRPTGFTPGSSLQKLDSLLKK